MSEPSRREKLHLFIAEYDRADLNGDDLLIAEDKLLDQIEALFAGCEAKPSAFQVRADFSERGTGPASQ